MDKKLILVVLLGILLSAVAIDDEVPEANVSVKATTEEFVENALSCRTVTGNLPSELNDCKVIEPLLQGLKFEDILCEACDIQSLTGPDGIDNCRKLTGKVPEEFKDCEVIKKALEGLQVEDVKCDTCGAASVTASLFTLLGAICYLFMNQI